MLKLDIIVHPSFSEPKVTASEPTTKAPKQWKWPWRINMLSVPRIRVPKYAPPVPKPPKTPERLDPGIEFRSDHLSRPPLRLLNVNLTTYKRGPKYAKNLTKLIDKSWGSIYNYYRKQLRDRRLKRLRRKLEKLKAKKPKGKSLEKIQAMKQEHWNRMAQPKKIPLPEKIPKKWKPLDDLLANIDVLAAPKEYHIVPPRVLGVVNPKALTYEITEAIQKLYHIPDRLKKQPEGLPLGYVKRSALRAKCNERIDKLALPSFSAREAKKHDEDKYDPWVISPNALKYKPTARILELAKPSERE
ncbi:uncharacterized protein Theg [Tribolium castaneum]|uniref:Uncharacterized protein n=1 Tax=Tribolium castaneum TaxID=7070 RepID=D6X1U7_TRICA|nr:hypothetical protein TcasGA2_TC012357 [Tribolium castaneum]